MRCYQLFLNSSFPLRFALQNEGENCLHNETPRERDFVAAGVPAQTFSVGNAAVRSVQHPRSLRTLSISVWEAPMSRVES